MLRTLNTGPLRVAVGAAMLLAAAPNLRADAPVTLKYNFKAGETNTYQTSGHISVPIPALPPQQGGKRPANQPSNLDVPLNITQKITVLKVLPNGSAQVEIESAGTMNMPGAQPNGSPITSKQRYTVSKDGSFAGAKTGAGSPGPGFGELSGVGALGSISVFLPDKPVSPGDTWSRTISMPQSSQTARMTATFVKYGQIGRYKTAHLKLTVIVPLNSNMKAPASAGQPSISISGKITMVYDTDFAIAEGKLVKSAGSGTSSFVMTMTGSQPHASPAGANKPMAITSKVTMTSTLVQ